MSKEKRYFPLLTPQQMVDAFTRGDDIEMGLASCPGAWTSVRALVAKHNLKPGIIPTLEQAEQTLATGHLFRIPAVTVEA